MARRRGIPLPWAKWWWEDWIYDQALAQCSFAAQGLWKRMLAHAALSERPGFLQINDEPLDGPAIARLVGHPASEVEPLLAELEHWGVFSRDRKGTIFNRRLVRDMKARADGQKNGRKGGNPSLCKQRGKPPPLNPPPNPPVKGSRGQEAKKQENNGEGPSPPSAGVPDHQPGVAVQGGAGQCGAERNGAPTALDRAAGALVAEFLHLHAVHWPDHGELRLARMPRLSLETEARHWLAQAAERGLGVEAALDVLGPAMDAAMERQAKRDQQPPRKLGNLHLTLADGLAKAAAQA